MLKRPPIGLKEEGTRIEARAGGERGEWGGGVDVVGGHKNSNSFGKKKWGGSDLVEAK